MVIKGKSRTNGAQLAAYLQKLDGNERIQIVEHHSPHDTLSETFRDWEVLADGVDGKKYLYHAQINPEARYVLTPEQWERAADVLETELGFTGQPRVIVFHEKDDGRQHVHVVWHRIDPEKMSLLDDGWNYLAHERASMALEQEFGHEKVLGKHAKRDREEQPEFPRAKYTLDEAQQFERNKIDPEQFKITLTAMYHHSDTAPDFKAALEDNGLILAKGDSKAFVIVDQDGEVYSLARQLTDVKTRELKQFLKDIPLPTVEQAEAQQGLNKVMDRWKQAETAPERPDPPEPERKPEPKPERQKQDAHVDMSTRTQSYAPTPEQVTRIERDLKQRYAEQGRPLDKQYQADLKRYIEEEELHNRLLEKLEQELRQEELRKKTGEPGPPKRSL